jgi:hypothetical protein
MLEGYFFSRSVARSFENVTQFKYFGMTVINQNLIQEEIKRRLNSRKNRDSSVGVATGFELDD